MTSPNPVAKHLRTQADQLDQEENRYGGNRVHPIAADFRNAADEIDRLHNGWEIAQSAPQPEKEYAWKMRAQSWDQDPYYVGSSAPIYPIVVIAPDKPSAITEATKMLGDAPRGRYWRFFNVQGKDLRLMTDAEKAAL